MFSELLHSSYTLFSTYLIVAVEKSVPCSSFKISSLTAPEQVQHSYFRTTFQFFFLDQPALVVCSMGFS